MSNTWTSSISTIVQTMLRPLTVDGGQFDITGCNPETHEIVVRAAMTNCEACAMNTDDLARLLQEAVQRTDPKARVTVVDA